MSKYDREEFQSKIEETNIVIPTGFKINGIRTIAEHLSKSKKCLYLAKGPSLEFVDNHLWFGHVATVNEACLRVPGPIDFAFFYDKNTLENSKPAWNRIKTFVMSSLLYGDKINDDYVSIADIDDLPLDRVLTFYKDQHEWDFDKIEDSLKNDEFVNTDTSVMGLHFLIMCGYSDILLLGHDGGVGYAGDIFGSSPNRNLTRFREIIEFVSEKLSNKYGVRIKFFGDMS